jgi:hypothetical protein
VLGIALHVAFLAFKRRDVSPGDALRRFPNEYGFFWPINRPEVYFRKKYLKYVRLLLGVFGIAVGLTIVFVLLMARRDGAI